MRLRIDYRVFLLLALWLLMIPPQWVLAFLAAAALHECFHIAVVLMGGGRVHAISIGPGSARIEASTSGPVHELVSIAAGPLGSLFLASGIHITPILSLCALVQGVFNFLPVFPLDGGRIVRLIFPRQASFVQNITIGGVLILMVALSARIGPEILLLTIPLIRKIPCKEDKMRVQ